MATFIELVKQGKYTPGQIDAWAEAWRESNSNKELYETIGMTPDQYERWKNNPDTLIPIIGEHGVVTQDEDLEIRNLKIDHNITGAEQMSNFMNACLVGEKGVDVSIAATAPAEYHAMNAQDFNTAMQRDLTALIDAGWSFEIQRGPNEDSANTLIDDMLENFEV